MADLNDLVPVDRAEFAAEITPCLVLVAPAGMSGDAQLAWMNAAYKALDGIPIALLKRGAAAALLEADHPAKIVPIIRREIGESWAWRRKQGAQRAITPDTPPAPRPSLEEAKEVGALMADLAKRMKAASEQAGI